VTTEIDADVLALSHDGVDSVAAWLRLATATVLGTIGGVGMWAVVVALPAVQAEFGVARGEASLAYTVLMAGFALGGVFSGRLADRYGIMVPVTGGAIMQALGFLAAGQALDLPQFALAHGLIGLGSSVTFAPLMTDISHWFIRRRGLAVAMVGAGSYFAGAVWPPTVQYFIDLAGWRATCLGIGLFCVATMLPLAVLLRRPSPAAGPTTAGQDAAGGGTLGLSPTALMALLSIAGVACCVAMSMPQVHMVAYCGDLGYGVARGSEMLALMLGFGLVSRIGSGFIADRIGGLATLLLGSALQGAALALYLVFDSLPSLYLIAVLFGLFQGGIVPSYPIIIREYFPSAGAGGRVGLVIMASVVGMALGGWMSGAVFDLTGSYRAAFANGLVWNLLNATIVLWLLLRSRARPAPLRPLGAP
jgi:MFS family permease